MKTIIITAISIIWIIIFSNCSTKSKEKIYCDNYLVRKYDLDSVLSLSIPHSWDSVNSNLFWSPEYKYYINVSNVAKNEGMIIKRLKFKTPDLDIKNNVNYLKKGVFTTTSYDHIKLLKEVTKHSGNRTIEILLFSLSRSNDKFYWGRIFFINKDSSNTIIEINTTDVDSSVSYNKINCILNSIEVKEQL